MSIEQNISDAVSRGFKLTIEPHEGGIAFRLFDTDGQQYAIRYDNDAASISRALGDTLRETILTRHLFRESVA